MFLINKVPPPPPCHTLSHPSHIPLTPLSSSNISYQQGTTPPSLSHPLTPTSIRPFNILLIPFLTLWYPYHTQPLISLSLTRNNIPLTPPPLLPPSASLPPLVPPSPLTLHSLSLPPLCSPPQWLLDCVQELGRAAAVLGLVFWITDQTTIDQPAMRNFSLALDRIPFVRDHHHYR